MAEEVSTVQEYILQPFAGQGSISKAVTAVVAALFERIL